GLPLERRAAELAALAAREAGRGFDLRRDPMLRATLLRLEEDEHAFLFTLHHIASDGWSEGVLRRELSALYAAALAGEPSPLAPLALQYADFAAWQRAWPEEALAAQLAHWKERLAGTPALDLPADRPRPPVASFRGDSLRLDLPPVLTEALRRLARRGQATVFMTVLAAWHALLQRHSGQTDFAIGTPVANRTRPELEPLIGVFLNMLALRTDGGGDPSFAELLARVRHTALAAYDHADIPFERIVDEVNVERDRSRPPLVQTMLALNSTPRVPLTLCGLAVEPLDTFARVSRFDLSLALSEQGGEVGGGLEYSTDLFDRTTMARLAGHFVHLLAAVADDPSRRVAEVELLSPAERQQVAVELNDTAADFSELAGDAEPLLHRWIERQAALTPDATAVVGESESLTYRELDARANRLARRLRRLGVRVDDPVAICADRSPALIVGLLAILKAGGAYLPLDPSYPSERLAFMIEDGLEGLAKPVLLAQVELLSASVAGAGARLVDLDAAAGPAGEADGVPLDGGAGADNLAYVIYTSGSTGRPKGVMSTHRGIVNRIAWMQRAYGLTPADRVLQKTPVSFDVSVWELFWPLVVGARLVLARPGGHRDPAYLMRRIEEQEVTTLHFVPSMLQVFLAQPGLGRCRSLRRVMASGEALPAELAARFHELLGSELHNLYGPTEASVDVTAHRTLPGPARRTVPIGRPIANLGIWLLDPELQPVPLGVPGELYIGGMGLARGYLRRPGLTAERFVPHPLGQPGERLYRTGDLARFSADGEIEFLGRTDDQVKLRGFRIEPGEIEAALAGHPAVREAAVVAREERPGEVRLAAWVVPAGPGPRPEVGELRDALRRVLPEHMVPADFALVDALPLTPSGKVDRGALRARPQAGELAPAAEPGGDLETELEELVAGIWQDLLRRGPIGRDDNLFDVG
ncbi:MAG TPA: amino acid adenylation domain-containing protein, partial [Thermoanaerobaculia bacterium]|nr:amino acid adenylation domain-containing protein [Thermoanaerobaculia bacterium]